MLPVSLALNDPRRLAASYLVMLTGTAVHTGISASIVPEIVPFSFPSNMVFNPPGSRPGASAYPSLSGGSPDRSAPNGFRALGFRELGCRTRFRVSGFKFKP